SASRSLWSLIDRFLLEWLSARESSPSRTDEHCALFPAHSMRLRLRSRPHLPTELPTSTDIRRRNNVRVLGRGTQPMVFVHGFGCDQNMWRFITPAFEDDYRIVLFDYVGSGKSDLAAYDARRYGALGGYVD